MKPVQTSLTSLEAKSSREATISKEYSSTGPTVTDNNESLQAEGPQKYLVRTSYPIYSFQAGSIDRSLTLCITE